MKKQSICAIAAIILAGAANTAQAGFGTSNNNPIATEKPAKSPSQSGLTVTGSGVRVKSIAFLDFDVYKITHSMKQMPAQKTKAAVIATDTDKKFDLVMMRDVEKAKMIEAFKAAFPLNGYTDTKKVDTFLAAMNKDLKTGNKITITYMTDSKETKMTLDGGGTSTIAGADFMKAVWSVWFGKIDQPKLGDAMISKLP